ncbi:MAG: site-2 protease family protein [Thermacetogeniaceae bacterium]
MFNLNLAQLLLWLPAVIIALTFHEYAHGCVADWLGDPTPRYQGRLTLNPLAHLDPLGFVLLLIVHFGWAKPVQVNPLNFRGDRYRGMVLVSLAGPGMNLLVAFTAMLIRVLAIPAGAGVYLNEIMDGIIMINIYLALFNLIPVPPLDGSQILAGLVRNADFVYNLQRYGYIILIVLIFSGIVWMVLGPASNFIYSLFYLVAQGIAHLVGL